MRQDRSTILYLFVLLIVLFGFGLFIFKDNLVNQFLSYSSSNEVVQVNPKAGALNLDILRDSRIKALKNYVNVFNYEDLNKSQDALQAAQKVQGEVIISNPEDGTTEVIKSDFVRVRVGNSNPFIVNKVVK